MEEKKRKKKADQLNQTGYDQGGKRGFSKGKWVNP